MVSPSIGPSTSTQPSNNDVELADVVRRFAPEYTSQYGATIMPSQKRALADIAACCTKQLGGRFYHCDDCRKSFWQYHCCRNRACPKCHGSQTQEWLEKRQGELLPCDYFHAVATVPAQMRDLFGRNQKFLYGLLMRVSVEAVKELCAKKRHLGGLPGILAVLHTWTGKLGYHPHVHMLITGGGATSDGQSWQPTRGQFLVPVHALSKKIAVKFRDALQKQAPDLFARIPKHVWSLEWVSFCKHYGHGNDAVLEYLSRYVFRTAITNARILAMDETHVTFRYKDHNSDTWKTERLTGVQFLHRFLQHVLPRGFHKVRYYGLWHHSKKELAARIGLLLLLQQSGRVTSSPRIADVLADLSSLTDNQDSDDFGQEPHCERPCRCPHCGSTRTRFLGDSSRYAVA
jgi:hypothetical protein